MTASKLRTSVFFLRPENLAFAKKKIDRPVLKESSRVTLWFLGLLFVASLIVLLIVLVPMWKEWYDYEYNGVRVSGELIAGWPVENQPTRSEIWYGFYIGEEWIESEQVVDDKYLDYLRDHENNLPVRYVKGDPDRSRLGGRLLADSSRVRIIITVVGFVWLALVGLGAGFALDSREQVTELVKNGRLVKGKVVSFTYQEPESAARAGTRGAAGAAFGCLGVLIFSILEGFLIDDQPTRSGTIKNAKLTLRYEFTSPESGKTIAKTERVDCKEFEPHGAPIPGIPVAVLYRSDKQYRVL